MLQRRGLSLDRLASFLAIADAGGLSRAAPGDPVRQSQLSRQLKELELALGQPLFVRSPRGLRLTAAGTSLARSVRMFDADLDAVSTTNQTPIVSLAAGDSVLQWLVLPSLAKLRVPALEVLAMGAEQTVSALQEGRVQLGVLRASEASGEFKTVRVGTVRYALFGAKDLPLAVPTGEPGLAPALALLPEPALRCETFPQLAHAVRAGTHAGVLPTFAARAVGVRHTTTPALERAASPLLLAWKRSTLERSPAVRELRLRLEELLRNSLSPREGRGSG
ncbi:MAG: LysR family transcriptional regulator [Myxococcaceae bacterium]